MIEESPYILKNKRNNEASMAAMGSELLAPGPRNSPSPPPRGPGPSKVWRNHRGNIYDSKKIGTE